MQIPGGDLAPARRRRYGGSYGRRRRRRYRVGLALLVVAGGVAAFLLTRTQAPRMPDRLAACPTPSPSASQIQAPTALPQPAQVHLALLNGTSRNGLASTVAAELAARGFVVTSKANAPAALPGPSQVVWGAGGQPAAMLLSHYVLGSVVLQGPHAAAGSVEVTLGSDYTRLATPAEVAAAEVPTVTHTAPPTIAPTVAPRC